MNKQMTMLSGVVIGAGTMYFLDPQLGRRRRAMMRDKGLSFLNAACEDIRGLVADLSNRAYGMAAETRAAFKETSVPDEVLANRVRSAMGRHVSHSRAISVLAHDGCITLSGPILENEVDGLCDAVCSVRGVKGVESRLDIHEEAGAIPALQG